METNFLFPSRDNTKLDYEVLSKVVQSGHSRIPVYKNVEVPDLTTIGKTRVIKKILGTMLVKNCVLLDPEDATPISSIPINTTFPSVPQVSACICTDAVDTTNRLSVPGRTTLKHAERFQGRVSRFPLSVMKPFQ